MTQEAALLPTTTSSDLGFSLIKTPSGAVADAGAPPFKDVFSGQLRQLGAASLPAGLAAAPNAVQSVGAQARPGQAMPLMGRPLPLLTAQALPATEPGEMSAEAMLAVMSGDSPLMTEGLAKSSSTAQEGEQTLDAAALQPALPLELHTAVPLVTATGAAPEVALDPSVIDVPPPEVNPDMAAISSSTMAVASSEVPALIEGEAMPAGAAKAAPVIAQAQVSHESSELPLPFEQGQTEAALKSTSKANAAAAPSPSPEGEPARFATAVQGMTQAVQNAANAGKTARNEVADTLEDGGVIATVETKPTTMPQTQLLGSHSTAANPGALTANANAALPMPLHHERWSEGLGQRLMLMVNHKIMEADVKLNPPHLGPLEIRIALSNDQASINFSTHHGAVKDVIEAALPRLREMLAEGGIQLADANVSDQRQRQPQNEQAPALSSRPSSYEDIHQAAEHTGIERVDAATRIGGVDFYV